VVKKKKEAADAKKSSAPVTVKSPAKKTPVKVKQPEVVKSPAENVRKVKSVLDVKKKLQMTESTPPEQQQQQQQKKEQHPVKKQVVKQVEEEPVRAARNVKKVTPVVEPESEQTSDFDDVSTVELNQIPDVTKWTAEEVYNYFVKHNFDRKDALKFIDQEIDGQTLLILQRDDLKSLEFKIGVFAKMWIHISRFQTRSDDISQTWH
jgi:hypothetical protein